MLLNKGEIKNTGFVYQA